MDISNYFILWVFVVVALIVVFSIVIFNSVRRSKQILLGEKLKDPSKSSSNFTTNNNNNNNHNNKYTIEDIENDHSDSDGEHLMRDNSGFENYTSDFDFFGPKNELTKNNPAYYQFTYSNDSTHNPQKERLNNDFINHESVTIDSSDFDHDRVDQPNTNGHVANVDGPIGVHQHMHKHNAVDKRKNPEAGVVDHRINNDDPNNGSILVSDILDIGGHSGVRHTNHASTSLGHVDSVINKIPSNDKTPDEGDPMEGLMIDFVVDFNNGPSSDSESDHNLLPTNISKPSVHELNQQPDDVGFFDDEFQLNNGDGFE